MTVALIWCIGLSMCDLGSIGDLHQKEKLGVFMQKITFNCETITPMFCYGAEENEPEIRAASIKGALRFWWRAINGHLQINELRKKETEIFGGSGDKKATKSNVFIRIKNITPSRVTNICPLPHKNIFTKSCFDKGLKFNVELKISNRNSSINSQYVKSLFILLSILGGLGGRSRRGFGNFKINSIDDQSFDKEINEEYIFQQIKDINSSFKFNQNHKNKNYPYLKKICFGKTGNYEELLKDIGKASHEHNSDYTGFAKGKNRMSSPIYVSINNSKNQNKILISELNCCFPGNWHANNNKKDDFIKELL